MLYTETKAIADVHRLIWQYISHFIVCLCVCLLSSIHFSDMFLSLKSMEFERIFWERSGAYYVNFEMES